MAAGGRGLHITLLTFFVLVCALGFTGAWAEQQKRVLIIADSLGKPFLQAINGFKQQTSEQSSVSFVELTMAQDRLSDAALDAALKQNAPDLIFTVGSDAAELALRNRANIPIVATLVLNATIFKAPNITGVGLGYPYATQIQWLKKFFPDKTKIAILFNPRENGKILSTLNKQFDQAGLELLPIPVGTPKQLPDALERLARYAEALLAIPDTVAMSPKTAKEVLLASFRNKIPFIGLSDNWVKSGAFYALSWDYDDLGKQCALQAHKILSGQPLNKIPPEAPRKLTYTINTKIAEHLDIEIPENLLRNAKMTFN